MVPDGEAQAADVSHHANVPDHANEDPKTNASLAAAPAATPRQVRERARRRVRKHALWRDTGSCLACHFSSPICADHASAVRVMPTLHHEPFWDDVTAFIDRVCGRKKSVLSVENKQVENEWRKDKFEGPAIRQ